MAAQRNYKAEYERRKANAKARGFTSPRTEGKARLASKGRTRDYAYERERAEQRAQHEGYFNAAQRRRLRKQSAEPKALELLRRAEVLNYFGISYSAFERIRRANRQWSKQYAQLQWTAINTYDIDRDRDVHNWSEQRVGYILSFHSAIVNPKTNHDSLYLAPKGTPRDAHGRPLDRTGKRITNESQYFYLVKYTSLMQVNEFEARYGTNVTSTAKTGKVKP